jgi:hypothetical protein
MAIDTNKKIINVKEMAISKGVEINPFRNKKIINVKGKQIEVFLNDNKDFISLTDIAKYKNPFFPADVVKNWMRTKSTIEFLGLWENINNPNFKLVEIDQFKKEAGSNHFVLSPQKWIESMNAIGLISKSGKNGGTFAHQDIALEFASWISSEFKLFLIKEFQRLKTEENKRLSLDWDVKRTLTKINYRIHTDAVKNNLIPKKLTNKQASFIYATEADVLNIALFGMTAKEWREKNKDIKGNIRDYADMSQLVCLSNLESFNALFIEKEVDRKERLIRLNEIAISQMKTLLKYNGVLKLKN